MFPKLSDLINYLLGTSVSFPVQTYGFFVALAFVVAGFLLYLELKRKEKEGLIAAQVKTIIIGKPASVFELVSSALLSFLVFYKIGGLIVDYREFSGCPQCYIMSLKGSWLVGIITAIIYTLWTYYDKQKKKLDNPAEEKSLVHPKHLAPTFLLIAAFAGIVGAKIFDVIEHIDQLAKDPVGILFSFSGLTFYGGLIVAAFAVAIYAERNKIPWPVIGDSVAPSLMIAYGIGRMGCQLSGDGCWGIVNTSAMPSWLSFLPDWMWAFNYPHNVIDKGIPIANCFGNNCSVLEQPVFPTPFYESILAILLFAALWSIRRRIITPGVLFSIYLILNGISRFFIEKIRVNIKYDIAGFQVTQAEIIAVLLMMIGVAGILYFRWKKHQKAATNQDNTP